MSDLLTELKNELFLIKLNNKIHAATEDNKRLKAECEKLKNKKIIAKPLEWEASELNGSTDWHDKHLGFYVSEDLAEELDSRFQASWGDSDGQYFSTLDEAKAWCQQEADNYMSQYAMVKE